MNREQRRAAKRKTRKRGPDRLRMTASHLAHIEGNQPVSEEKATGLMLELWSAFDALKAGSDDMAHLTWIASSMNTAVVLAERIDQEVVDVILAAHDAIREAAEIKDRHGKIGFTGPGMQAIAEALDVYGQIVRLQTPRAIWKAAEEGHRRARAQYQAVVAARRAAA